MTLAPVEGVITVQGTTMMQRVIIPLAQSVLPIVAVFPSGWTIIAFFPTGLFGL